MNDLDERLRDDFADLVDGNPLDLGIDVDRVLDAGRRVRRARAISTSLGGAAVAVLAAAVAWGGIAAHGITGATVVPAAPSPSWADPAYFDVSDLGLAASTDFDKVQLAVTAASEGWDVEITTSRSNGLLLSRLVTRADLGTGTSAVWVQQVSPQVSVALLPARTRWWQVAMRESTENLRYVDWTHPGLLDLTAAILVFDEPRQASDVAGFLWEAADGSLVNSFGDPVRTAQATVAGQRIELYWDPTLKQLGIRTDGGPSLQTHADLEKPYAYPRLQSRKELMDGRTVAVLADLLPPGAHDLRVDLAAPDDDWTAVELGGRTGYVIVAGDNRPIGSLSYTDAAGRTVVWRK
jgi:hypothetical protein